MLNRLLIVCCMLSGIAYSAWAVEQPLADPEQEAHAYALFHQIRCSSCAGQTIAESPSDAAADLRQAIRVQVAAGQTDTAVEQYLVTRYGNAIMVYTPMTAATAVLWFGPFAMLVVVGIVIWVGVKWEAAKNKK